MEEPLSKNAVANARSFFGNHSATAFVAAGQVADSPAPNKNRHVAKLNNPRDIDVSMDTTEYQTTVMVKPRRVPMRSNIRPNTA